VTAAVKVTGCPDAIGFAEEMSVAVVAVVPVASVLPVSATDCGLPGALSVMETVPPSKKDDEGEGWY